MTTTMTLPAGFTLETWNSDHSMPTIAREGKHEREVLVSECQSAAKEMGVLLVWCYPDTVPGKTWTVEIPKDLTPDQEERLGAEFRDAGLPYSGDDYSFEAMEYDEACAVLTLVHKATGGVLAP